MKIAVMGAGAVGCYYGAMLALAGHAVTMIGRPGPVAAMQAKGLILHKGRAQTPAPVTATTDPAGVAGAELVLVAVKSDDSAEAARTIAPHLAPGATVISLQNGVDNAERIGAILGRPVLSSAVYVAADSPAAGHVRHNGRGELVIGESAASAVIAEAFTASGVPTTVSPDVDSVLWTKLTVNCAYNALCAIAQLPYGRMIAVEGVREVMEDVVAECRMVAEAAGVALPADILDTVMGLAAGMPTQTSSTAQDLLRGKRTEIGHLNGFVVRTAQRHGLRAPVNRSLLAAIRMLEEAGAGAA
ncbi:ketopantoate reductase family protein [Bosea sp. TWI1241]|uniref:ketopantoate reductase family protein n=1 Tax=Bosea sp. TWI1241 TaxID=3148904 RepID=UPI003208A11D